jgi:predicted RNA binding protein YcfA (HicA-like mRNA interferase family)
VPNLHTVSGVETIKALERLGFRQVRQRGSHIVLRKDSVQGAVGCAVPLHKELKIGTLRGILRQAKVEPDEFLKVL